jgi:oligoendopeptidase F
MVLWSATTVVAIALLAGAVNAATPGTLVRDSIPDQYKWDLSKIYSGWDAWEDGLGQLEDLMGRYSALKGTLAQGPEQVLQAYQISDSLGMILYKVYRYPALMRATDTRNNEVSGRLQRVQIMLSRFNTETAWFDPEMLAIPWETMKGWLDETEDLAPYRHGIEDLYRQQKHVLSEEMERLLSYYSRFNSTPSSIYSELSVSDIEYPTVTLSDGKEVKLTPGAYYNILAGNRNQEDRATAFKNFYGTYVENVNTYAAIYNGVLQRDWASAQARNYGSTLEAALDGDNVPEEVFENLMTSVKAGTDPVQRYMRLRKKALGLETYHLYDGSIPLVDFHKEYDYDEVKPWILEAVAPLGKEYQAGMKEIFDGRWIDVYENEGKRGGAFSAGVYGVHPYMLMNYNQTLDNVFTLAHEAGHAMHSKLSYANQPFATADYTIFVAEVASTLNEALLLEYLFNKSEDPKERVMLLQQAIDNIVGTFYTQVLFADYEWQAHKMVEEGKPITAEALQELYSSLEHEYHGDAVVLDEYYHSTWSRISHFYGSPYYVYKYATCFASSAKLVSEILSQDEKTRAEATKRYLTLLKSGGNDYPNEQLKKAGVDLSQPETIQSVVAQLDKLVTRLETELEKLEG